MMVEILDPQEGESIYDPACGTGGMLLGAIEHVMRKGGDPRTFYGKIYGQEKNLTTSAIARMNLVLHGIEDFQIAREDTLRSPAFTDSSTSGIATFDCVIANPPFSLKEWGRELWEADPWGRAQYGIPPESYGDYAFVQHMISSMAPTGNSRMAVVLPQGALFRKSAEGAIRQALLENDMIEAVIGLAPEPVLWHTARRLRGRAPAQEAGRAQEQGPDHRRVEPVPQRPRTELPRPGAQRPDRRLVPRLRGCRGSRQGRHHRRDQEGRLDAQHLRYVLPPIGEDIPPLPEAVDAFKTALADARAAEDHLRKVLTEGGWLQ
jgi:type I restriction enzyme M protein